MASGVRFLDRISENRISFILIQHSIFCLFFQDAKETLLDPAKRSNYDKWRNSGIKISYKNWLGMKEHVHQVKKIIIATKIHLFSCDITYYTV